MLKALKLIFDEYHGYRERMQVINDSFIMRKIKFCGTIRDRTYQSQQNKTCSLKDHSVDYLSLQQSLQRLDLDLELNMDLDQSPALQIETPTIMNNHILHTKSLTVSRLLSLFVILSLVLISQSCSRSPYQGSAAYDCEGGDRVILNERLFCVYNEYFNQGCKISELNF